MTENNPLVEVFGYPKDDFSEEARRHRQQTLCPYNNHVPECTKDRKSAPLGACNVHREGEAVITCPKRFREGWQLAGDAANFFFEDGTTYEVHTELRLKTESGKSAGNIDAVLVAYDDAGEVADFGGLEVQAVYVSGNMRNPFEHYMEDPAARADFDWRTVAENYPSPDYRSSEKRLIRQLQSKGRIIDAWGKRQAVAVQKAFYETLTDFSEVDGADADIVWLIYDLVENDSGRYELTLDRRAYMDFEQMLEEAGASVAGEMGNFTNKLKDRRGSGKGVFTL